MESHQLINADSGDYEYYTPPEIIEAARQCMGSIDLDPFSSVIANDRVKATTIFTEEDNGWEQEWYGNIWINHPFSRENNKRLAEKVLHEYKSGNVKNICMITYAATSEAWWKQFLDFPQCFLYGRTNYYLPDGTKKKGVTKGSCVTYIGGDLFSFWKSFNGLGKIKVPYNGE